MRKIIPKYFIVFLLSVISLLSGCYTYFEISKEEYLKKEKHNKTKFLLTNENEVFIENPDSIKIPSDMDKIIISQDSTQTVILISEIKQIREQKYDTVKSLFTFLWITLISFLTLGVTLYILFGGIPKMG